METRSPENPLAICCWSVGPSLSTDDWTRLAISKEIDDMIVSLFSSSSFQAQQVTAARFQTRRPATARRGLQIVRFSYWQTTLKSV